MLSQPHIDMLHSFLALDNTDTRHTRVLRKTGECCTVRNFHLNNVCLTPTVSVLRVIAGGPDLTENPDPCIVSLTWSIDELPYISHVPF